MILFERVYKRYPNGREALSDVSFSVARAEMMFLTGHSGAGKSTVLKLIALIDRPSRGQVIVNQQNTAGVPRRSPTVAPRARPPFSQQIQGVAQEVDLQMGASQGCFEGGDAPVGIEAARHRLLGAQPGVLAGRCILVDERQLFFPTVLPHTGILLVAVASPVTFPYLSRHRHQHLGLFD